MKKKLFLALLTTLVLLLAATTALAVSPSDYNCTTCGEPCTEWYPVVSTDGTIQCHAPLCMSCLDIVRDAAFPCTPVEGTATCVTADVCSVCNYPDRINSTPDPNAHDMSRWQYNTSAQHYRFCINCNAEDTYEYEDHYGGTATCTERAICEVCNTNYGEFSTEHAMSKWEPISTTQHRKFCTLCWAVETIIYEDHYGGTATCRELAVCEGCGDSYGNRNLDNHDWGDWEGFSASTHIRVCRDCSNEEEAPHTGGDGSCFPICSECGWNYSNPDGEHRNLSDWYPYSMTQHYRECLGCAGERYTEYGEHQGGDGSCHPTCKDCGAPYTDENGKHSNMCDWFYNDAAQHRRYCLDCTTYESNEYEDHYGGTATCTQRAVCEGCGAEYGEPDPSKHANMSDWSYFNETQHFRYCLDCVNPDSYEYAAHTGGDGSCLPVCEECDQRYIDENGKHSNMCDWIYNDAAQHRRYCLTCGTSASNEYEDHYGGTATCTERAVCEGCGTEYGEYSDVHPWGEWEYLDDTSHQRPCTNPDCHASDYADHSGGDGSCRPECEGCGNLYYNAEGQHRTMSVWYYLDGAQHMRHCADCGYGQEYEDHTGGTATCSAKSVCEVCYEDYGELDGTRHGFFSDWETIGTTQHSRYCLECGANEEYEDHYGGTATCSSRAICEGCGSSYGELNLTVHTNMSEWRPHADGHERHCLDCNLPTSFERAPHTGDGACESACIDCHKIFIDPNGEHSLTDWLPENDTQHIRYCNRCYGDSTYEYADHVGDGTCTSECKDCGMTFTDPDGTHRLTKWSASSPKKHIRYCPDCQLEFTFESGEHRPNANAEDLPCYKTITCTDCGYNMGFGTQHSLSDWVSYSPLQHMRYCTVGGVGHVAEYDLHYGGDGSCMSVCEGCGEAYIPLNGTHQWGEWTPNADGTHTRVCALNEEHTETADCTWGDWTLADDQYHIRVCTDCGDEETGEHTGGTATCYSPRICDVCNEGYGSPDNSGLSGHPNPTIEVKPGTCYDEGYYRVTCDHPGCTMPFFEIATPANGQHIYNDWQPVGDGSHISACHYCGEELTVPCTVFTAELFAACPICGEYEGGVLAVVYAHDDDESLPYGTLVIRGGEIPVDGAMCAITVAGSYGGQVVELTAPVTVRIPMELTGFRVVNMNGEEIPFTLENGVLTFETAKAGLFLLVPAE